MKGGQPILCGLAAWLLLSIGGCAIGPAGADLASYEPVAERDLLAEAAQAVETAQWPEPESGPALAWLIGGGGERFSKSDAIDYYVDALTPAGARFHALALDADATLEKAARLHAVAASTADAARVSMNDVARVENAIQTLRQHRDIYWASAKALDKAGEPVDDERLSSLRRAFAQMIRDLGDAADALADRVQADRSSVYASPDRIIANRFSDL